ncbi:MAG: SUMF1/EgtB/PvdO family nonheme iron enzyme [Planctomycetota bacterium]
MPARCLLLLLLASLIPCAASAQQERQGRTFVLIVGIDDYADPKLTDLKFAEADARAVYRFYADDPGSPTIRERVKLLVGAEATRRNVLRALRDHLEVQATEPEDTAVFYFSGHGLSDARSTYLACQDTTLVDLEFTAITLEELQRSWDRIRARSRVLVADACHSGGLGGLRGPGSFGKRILPAAGRELRAAVFTSTGENQLAAEDAQSGHGVFTSSLLAALRGAADVDDDGSVSAAELGAFLARDVPSRAARVRGKQTPQVSLSPGAEALRLSSPKQTGPRPIAGDAHAARLEAERRAAEAERERAEQQKALAEQKAQASAVALAAAEARLKELEAQRGASAEELERARADAKRLAGEAGQAQAALAKAKESEQRAQEEQRKRKEEELKRIAAEKRKAEVELENAELRRKLAVLEGRRQEADLAQKEAEAAKARGEALDERKRALEGGASRQAGGDYAAAVAAAKRLAGVVYLDTKVFACGGQRFEVARFRHEGTGLVFHLVPAGSFQREGGERVVVRAFLICATECTQAAWGKVMGSTPSQFAGRDRPVEQVSWDDAQGFCRRAALRLPSEAEWEYACRAGTQTTYCFGDNVRELGRYAVSSSNSGGRTAEVGSRLPNAFGLFDVHGNVWEWCQDAWDDGPQGAPTDGSAREGADASRRAYRGGGWNAVPWGCRSAYRHGYEPGQRFGYLGFRPARSVP